MRKAKDNESCSACMNMGNRRICEFFWLDDDEVCEHYKEKVATDGTRICKEVLQKQSLAKM